VHCFYFANSSLHIRLGLYISKGIVSQHKGRLDVSSEGLSLGTTFTCTLPLYHLPMSDTPEPIPVESKSSTSSKAKSDSSTENHPLRILIVDDVATNRKLLSRLAARRGHFVDEASDGSDAVNKVRIALDEGNTYDTILMDFEMPVMKGPEATKDIRLLGCDSFVVGVTGNVLEDDVAHFISCGANHVLPKPVKFAKLEDLWFEYGVQGDAAEAKGAVI